MSVDFSDDSRKKGQRTLDRFVADDELARKKERKRVRHIHRRKYWNRYDKDTYECPDCGRVGAQVEQLHVHHIDRNPFNGDWSNLLALCRDCHFKRHGYELRGSLQEWKANFLAMGEEMPK